MSIPALLLLSTTPAPRRRPSARPAPARSAAAPRPSRWIDDDNLLGALGGERGIGALVDALIAAVAADPQINRQFASANPARLRRLLIAQFTVLSLGPVRAGDPVLGLDLTHAHRSDRLDHRTVRAVTAHLETVLEAHRLPLTHQGRLLSRFAAAFAAPPSRTGQHRHR